jgi:acetyl-CoA carboxylase carboxyltransferase component
VEPELERDRLAADYADEHLGAQIAAQEGFIDEVIEPDETRARIAWGLATLNTRGARKRDAGNIPL